MTFSNMNPFAHPGEGSSTGGSSPTAIANTASYPSSQAEYEKGGARHREKLIRQKSGGLRRRGTGSSETRVNFVGKMYQKITKFPKPVRYTIYILPFAVLLAIPILVLGLVGWEGIYVGESEIQDGEIVHGPHLFFLFIWIEVTWVTIFAVKILAWLLPIVFVFLCGIVSSGVRKYATILTNLIPVLQFFLWTLTTWLTFRELVLSHVSINRDIAWVVTMQRITGALAVSSGVLLVEKTVVQLISVSYHQRSFANRIKASKSEVHLLGILYDASRVLFPMYCPEFMEEDIIIKNSIDSELIHKRRSSGAITPITTGAQPRRILGNVTRFGGKVTAVVGKAAGEITGKQLFKTNSSHNIIIEALEKKRASEALARRVWLSFVEEGSDTLTLEDFKEVIGTQKAKEAEDAFEMIDSDINGDVSLEEMINKVVEIGEERKAISGGMRDIGGALKAFDKVLLVGVLVITIFIFLAFFKSSFLAVLATAGTTLLSLGFMFAVTAQEFLGSCIFLFVKHPYDVGDRVDINGNQLIVEKISLMYSVFHRLDTMKVTQIPNILLNTLWIENVSRSKAMAENIQVDVSFDTTFEDVELLRQEMEDFVRAPENYRDFQRDFTISVGGVGNLDKLTLFATIKHKSNWHNDAIRARRRSKFMCAFALALKKVPIYPPGGGCEPLGGPLNPSYSVTVSDQFAIQSRDKAAKMKEDAKYIPPMPGDNEPIVDSASAARRNAANERLGVKDGAEQPRFSRHLLNTAETSSIYTGHSRTDSPVRKEHGFRKHGERVPSSAAQDLGSPVPTPKGGSDAGSIRAASVRAPSFDIEAQLGPDELPPSKKE